MEDHFRNLIQYDQDAYYLKIRTFLALALSFVLYRSSKDKTIVFIISISFKLM